MRRVIETIAGVVLSGIVVAQLPTTGGSVVAPIAKKVQTHFQFRLDAATIPLRLRDREGGHVDRITYRDGEIILDGWAIDINTKKPAKSVQFFVGDRHVGQSIPALSRPDVAAVYGTGTTSFGFHAIVRGGRGDSISAFAEGEDGYFAKLIPPSE